MEQLPLKPVHKFKYRTKEETLIFFISNRLKRQFYTKEKRTAYKNYMFSNRVEAFFFRRLQNYIIRDMK